MKIQSQPACMLWCCFSMVVSYYVSIVLYTSICHLMHVQVFSCLEASLDAMSKAAGHHAYIFEAGAGGNLKKLGSHVTALLAPGGTLCRRPQQQLPTQPWDIQASSAGVAVSSYGG
jgi:hypothetical protein